MGRGRRGGFGKFWTGRSDLSDWFWMYFISISTSPFPCHPSVVAPRPEGGRRIGNTLPPLFQKKKKQRAALTHRNCSLRTEYLNVLDVCDSCSAKRTPFSSQKHPFAATYTDTGRAIP